MAGEEGLALQEFSLDLFQTVVKHSHDGSCHVQVFRFLHLQRALLRDGDEPWGQIFGRENAWVKKNLDARGKSTTKERWDRQLSWFKLQELHK